MKRLVLLGASLAIFGGAAYYGSTGAFFSDSETSTGNTFTAGDIDLTIDNESYVTNNAGTLVASPANSWALADLTNQLFFSFGDVKPGDVGEDTISVHAGSNDAYACMAADITSTPDNGINDPEADAGDVTDGAQGGELQNFLNFTFWNDDGDNVYEVGETQITQLTGPANSIFNGSWAPIVGTSTTAIPGGTTRYVAKAWCFGNITGTPVAQDGLGKTGSNGPLNRSTGFSCDGSGSNNIAQTDGIVVDVSFQAVQARNNANFTCASLPPFVGASNIVEVTANDIATTASSTAWLFYNDTNDTVMTINQFSGTGGVNNVVAGPDGVGAAQMTLDTGVDPRYNIATYKYKDVKLSNITNLKYRVYDATADSDTPYLHLNVDFANNDTWQGRLVQVAAPLTPNTWTTVDALAGTWTKTQGNWPAGLTSNGSLTGSTARTWAQIVADYPNAETRSTDSFLGIRVGQPGPAAATGYIDWIQFNNETTDFE